MKYIVYIIYSNLADKYYVGYTADDIQSRIRKHNSNHKGFTGKFNDWKICFTEEFDNKSIAIKREKEIKNMKSRIYIENLISKSEHPDF
jgi:putative endonuclease